MEIDDRIIQIFEIETKKQARDGLAAFRFLDNELNLMKEGNRLTNPFWYHMQMLLVSTANISKILWGSKGSTHQEEREVVKNSLKVDDNFYIRNRDIRNSFEHIDNRLINWISTNSESAFFDQNIGSIDNFSNFDPSIFLRHYDPESNILHFRGDKWELNKVIEELQHIAN